MRYQNLEHFKEACGYVINGIWYPRVTKILEIKSKPALEVFLKEVGDYSSAENIKNKSAEEGSFIHGVVEKVAVGLPVEVPEEIKPAVSAFSRLKEERGIIFLPEFIELRFWSERYRYAGTADALALVGGKLGVLDIKTSSGFYPEHNLQTAAYVSALQELTVRRSLSLPREIQTRWILRIDQKKFCRNCGAAMREKGGRTKIKNGGNGSFSCPDGKHEWGELQGEAELKEFPYLYKDIRAFLAAKILWEWENDRWLRQAGYYLK